MKCLLFLHVVVVLLPAAAGQNLRMADPDSSSGGVSRCPWAVGGTMIVIQTEPRGESSVGEISSCIQKNSASSGAVALHGLKLTTSRSEERSS